MIAPDPQCRRDPSPTKRSIVETDYDGSPALVGTPAAHALGAAAQGRAVSRSSLCV